MKINKEKWLEMLKLMSLVDDVEFNIENGKIETTTATIDRVVLVRTSMKIEGKEKLTFAQNVSEIKGALNILNNEEIEVKMDEGMILLTDGRNKIRLPDITIQTVVNIPELNFTASFITNGKEMGSIAKTMKFVDEGEVVFVIDKKKVVTAEINGDKKATLHIDTVGKVKADGDVKASYGDYIEKISNLILTKEKVEVNFGNDYPIEISIKDEDLSILYNVAPKVEKQSKESGE